MLPPIRFASESLQPQPQRQQAPKPAASKAPAKSNSNPSEQAQPEQSNQSSPQPAQQPAQRPEGQGCFRVQRPAQPEANQGPEVGFNDAGPSSPPSSETEQAAGPTPFKVARPTGKGQDDQLPDIDEDREYAVC